MPYWRFEHQTSQTIKKDSPISHVTAGAETREEVLADNSSGALENRVKVNIWLPGCFKKPKVL